MEPIGMALPTIAIPPNIAGAPIEERLRTAIEATISKVPSEVGQQLKQLLQPQTLAIAAGILVIWAGLHFTGVGEVADAAILVVGWIALGAAAWQGARELITFAIGVKQARTPQDIDRAADHLAKAIGLIGIQAVLSLLLHTAPKPYREPSNLSPQFWKGWWNLGAPPRSPIGRWAYRPTVRTVPSQQLDGALGVTSYWGDIEISSSLSEADAQATLLHEQVHASLTPKLYLLRDLRVQIKTQGYNRSVVLRYIEEAMAETYALLATKGLNMNALVSGVTFPVTSQGYDITLAKMGTEAAGVLLGPINVAGMTWNAWSTTRRK
jgi:hypothetical protein